MKGFLFVFKLRCIICVVLVFSLMLLCIGRVANIMQDERLLYSKNVFNIELGSARGEIYDRNGVSLTSCKKRYAIVFLPCEAGKRAFLSYADMNERQDGLEKINNGRPTVLYSDLLVEDNGTYCFEIPNRYDDKLCLGQTLGYLDSTKHGAYGIEKAYDDVLYSQRSKTARLYKSSGGDFLPGIDAELTGGDAPGSVHLTIDTKIQEIAAAAAEGIKKGAVVITDISCGEIRAMVSKPMLTVNSLADAVKNENEPFLNRPLMAYSVGSIFKPLVAGVLLENGGYGFKNNCNGVLSVMGIDFYCNNRNGHGQLSLEGGLALSCNTYFYSAALKQKPQSLYSAAVACGFKAQTEIARGITAAKGRLTSLQVLERSKAAVANFAIGQGDIVLSPLVMCNLYSAIANNGIYFSPRLVKGYTKNNKYFKGEGGTKNVLFSSATAAILKNCLINTVKNGTGKNALPDLYGAGGKTATAQTGQYANGKELLNSWFCGFFPADSPKYCVTILVENGISGGYDAAPVFKKIADEVNKLKK